MKDGGSDPIPIEVNEFIRFYEKSLGDEVKFPDMSLTTLQDAATKVRLHAEVVEEARAALESAKAELDVSKVALRGKAERALAYARVYSEGNESLESNVDKLKLSKPKSRAKAPAKRRGRRKSAEVETQPVSSEEFEPRISKLPFIESANSQVVEASVPGV